MSLLTSSSSYSYKNTNSKYVVCNEVVDLARLLSGLRQENLSDILILSFSFYYHEFVIKKKKHKLNMLLSTSKHLAQYVMKNHNIQIIFSIYPNLTDLLAQATAWG